MPTFVRDDSGYRKDNGIAAWGLLVIPLFLLLVGLGAYNLYTSSKTSSKAGQTNSAQSSGNSGLQFGVGGAAPTATPKPSNTPTPSLSPTPRVTSTSSDGDADDGQQVGVGGGPVTPTIDYSDSPQVPAGAPQTGAGGGR